MNSFDRLTAMAAPLPLENVDTDKILAGRFLETIALAGLGQARDRRHRAPPRRGPAMAARCAGHAAFLPSGLR